MLSKFAAGCALVMTASYATEAEAEWKSYGAPSYSYGSPAPYGGYGHGYGYAAPKPSYGFEWGRRSTIRPRDVKAFNAAPVDGYWKDAPKVDETIIASCEFDFLGYSHSSGRLELKQEAGDLTSIIGEFENLKPGLHALKIHEWGDLSYGCESTGDVFNPFGAYQGHSHEDIYDRRVGDLEHVQARWDTDAEYKNRDLLVNLSGPNSVIGRAMVIYEDEDDHDQTEHPPTHDREGRFREGMGQRIGCCVIGLAKGEKKKPEPVPEKPIKLAKPEPVHYDFPRYQAPKHAPAYPAYGYGPAPRW